MVESSTHDVLCGKRIRKSFATVQEVLDMPDLIEVQKRSYQQFLEHGMREVLSDISPITEFTGVLSLDLCDYRLEEKPKYTIEECKERDVTWAVRMYVKVRLTNRVTGEVKEQEVYMGDFPKMTDHGTFIINGAERVIVSQLVRSPGVIFESTVDKNNRRLFSSTIIPSRGAWLEYETDSNDVLWIRIDKGRKQPATVLIRALGWGTDEEILNLLGEEEHLTATLEKDTAKSEHDGLIEIFKRLRPGDPATEENAREILSTLFFNTSRYDLARVGRYKINKKLALGERLRGHELADDVVDPRTGEVVAEAGRIVTEELGHAIENCGARSADIWVGDHKKLRVVGNLFVEYHDYLAEFGITDDEMQDLHDNFSLNEKVHYPTLVSLMDTAIASSEDPVMQKESLIGLLKNNIDTLIPKYVYADDIVATQSYELGLFYGVGREDDIDHLGNRRLRSVGELLQNQIRVGLARLERVVKERMSTQDMENVTPQNLINVRPVAAAVKEFFGSSQLSQFMDQTNPLSELTNKRRLSALGPGGLNRDRATFEVRDVHYSHYGRICPIETPEGPNIGLIGSLAIYARINEYGFLETPYRRIDPVTHCATDEVRYMSADEEDLYVIGQAREPLDENGRIIKDRVTVRAFGEIVEMARDDVQWLDVSPRQVVSVATAMIPFVESDASNRALMGSNMQRQAVPLLVPEAPLVATGMEGKAGHDSGVVVLAREAGYVESVQSDKIVVRRDDGEVDTYTLQKFVRSNQSTCINQRPVVKAGDRVEKDDVLADGPSTDMGEIALGRNILMAFMCWEGYNHEDAILISEELVKNDALTSIHIEEYECECRETKLGPEEITYEVPNVGDEAKKDLDERGIIRIGAEVTSGDILVGKVTPKGETELNAEERLLRAIFGEKSREVRDTSLRVPHGEAGIIVDVKVFNRENHSDMAPGVTEVIRVYIAQRRKISVGDKMAGRHGNKGVVSRILPEEDMPFLPDGRPIQIVLTPMGVPSRLNIGQVLEVHLGMVAKLYGWHVATPVFDSASEGEILRLLNSAEWDQVGDGKVRLRDGRTGEFFDSPATVGYMYMLKLHHLVDDKIHARSTGPYSLVTQQPLGGKAQFGGQRFGEMEVWALEGYGAAHTLQEILTVKSDDVVGRVKTYEAIVKGENIPEPGIPESFKVLIKELQSLSLDVKILDEKNGEIVIREGSMEDGVPEVDMEMGAQSIFEQGNSDTEDTVTDYDESYSSAEDSFDDLAIDDLGDMSGFDLDGTDDLGDDLGADFDDDDEE